MRGPSAGVRGARGFSRRSMIAVGAVVIGIGGPLVYAGIMGHQAAVAEASERRRAPAIASEQAAARVAERLGDRLARLEEQESERPFFHYQNFIVDPRGAYEGTAVVPSPLADAVADPLIAGYFQVDNSGKVTMPRVPEGVADAAPAAPRDLELLAALRMASIPRPPRAPEDAPGSANGTALASLVRTGDAAAPNVAPNAPELGNGFENEAYVSNATKPSPKDFAAKGSVGNAGAKTKPVASKRAVQQVVLPEQQYQQNIDANELYNAIQTRSGKGGPNEGKAGPVVKPIDQQQVVKVIDQHQMVNPIDQQVAQQPDPWQALEEPVPSATRDVVVRVGPLAWQTMQVAGRPALAAVRLVEAPDGTRTQGFVVDAEALTELGTDLAPGAVLLAPGASTAPAGAKVQLPGVDWRVVVPSQAAQDEAEQAAEAIIGDFQLRFAGMSILALLAMIAVVWALWLGERHLERRQRFAAAAAHELRTPLAGLRMYAEMLAHGLGKPEKQKLYAERLATEAGRLGRVVANVLDFTRLQRGNLSVKPTTGDLAAVVREQVARLEPAIQATGAALTLSVPATRVEASFDADAVHQIIQNLVDNAEKYGRTSSDRTIAVTVTGPSDAGDAASVSVRDHGPGLPARFESRLFVPFARGDDKDGPAGLGLGLALTRALARAQGGDVRFRRPAEGGAEFVVSVAASAG